MATRELPRWSGEDFYSGFQSETYKSAVSELKREIETLREVVESQKEWLPQAVQNLEQAATLAETTS